MIIRRAFNLRPSFMSVQDSRGWIQVADGESFLCGAMMVGISSSATFLIRGVTSDFSNQSVRAAVITSSASIADVIVRTLANGSVG